jgi:hypothetical protein
MLLRKASISLKLQGHTSQETVLFITSNIACFFYLFMNRISFYYTWSRYLTDVVPLFSRHASLSFSPLFSRHALLKSLHWFPGMHHSVSLHCFPGMHYSSLSTVFPACITQFIWQDLRQYHRFFLPIPKFSLKHPLVKHENTDLLQIKAKYRISYLVHLLFFGVQY